MIRGGLALGARLRWAVGRADAAVDFFIGLIRQWYGAAEHAFFPGYGKVVAGAAGCACCVIFVAIALLLEPSFQSQSILPAATPLQAVEEIPAEEPFDLEALIAEYEQTTRARAQAAPVTVSIPPEQQLSLTMDSLKNYELASALLVGQWIYPNWKALGRSGRHIAMIILTATPLDGCKFPAPISTIRLCRVPL